MGLPQPGGAFSPQLSTPCRQDSLVSLDLRSRRTYPGTIWDPRTGSRPKSRPIGSHCCARIGFLSQGKPIRSRRRILRQVSSHGSPDHVEDRRLFRVPASLQHPPGSTRCDNGRCCCRITRRGVTGVQELQNVRRSPVKVASRQMFTDGSTKSYGRKPRNSSFHSSARAGSKPPKNLCSSVKSVVKKSESLRCYCRDNQISFGTSILNWGMRTTNGDPSSVRPMNAPSATLSRPMT